MAVKGGHLGGVAEAAEVAGLLRYKSTSSGDGHSGCVLPEKKTETDWREPTRHDEIALGRVNSRTGSLQDRRLEFG